MAPNNPRTRVTAKSRFKEMPCRVCGTPMQVGSNTRNTPRCVECGVRAMADNLVSLRSHAGPSWERWLEAQRIFLDRMHRG